MNYFQSKYGKLPGSSYSEVLKKARLIFREIEKQSKRSPYVRSSYFDRQKIFLSYFWSHLEQKTRPEKLRRMRYYQCAIDLLKNTMIAPSTIKDTTQSGVLLHRFAGKTKDGDVFFVQVKENRNTGKYFMSVFPQA
jgi:hypothetical protein